MPRSIVFLLLGLLTPLAALAQEAPPTPPPAAGSTTAASPGADLATQAVAAQAMQANANDHSPDLLEYVVDRTLDLFDVRTGGNTTIHYVIATLFLVLAVLLRRLVTAILFTGLKRLAAKTKTTLDDKLIPAMEGPCSTAIVLFGLFAALRVLKLSPAVDTAIGHGSTVAFSLVTFWALLRAFSVLLDHAYEIAQKKEMGIAAFMPWIKKTLIAIFCIVGVLMILQSLNFDVKALLAGLGIGGLAFALAAQDTIANVFGSVVIAIDQPFKTGEFVVIGGHAGVAEDIGLRSTRLRTLAGNLIVLPNKMVAAEAITNNARFIRRRADQVVGLTYTTSPEKMEALVTDIRNLIEGEPEVDPTSVHVYFRDYSASSQDIWIAYNTRSPDFVAFMKLRQRINLEIGRLVAKHELEFAFPTQTIHLDGAIARQMAEGRKAE